MTQMERKEEQGKGHKPRSNAYSYVCHIRYRSGYAILTFDNIMDAIDWMMNIVIEAIHSSDFNEVKDFLDASVWWNDRRVAFYS